MVSLEKHLENLGFICLEDEKTSASKLNCIESLYRCNKIENKYYYEYLSIVYHEGVFVEAVFERYDRPTPGNASQAIHKGVGKNLKELTQLINSYP